MSNIDPKWVLLAGVVLAVITATGVVVLAVTGHTDNIPVLTGIMVPILLTLLGVKTAVAAQQAEESAKSAKIGVQQNDTIIRQVANVQQSIKGNDGCDLR